MIRYVSIKLKIAVDNAGSVIVSMCVRGLLMLFISEISPAN